jgi:hypothetical protein
MEMVPLQCSEAALPLAPAVHWASAGLSGKGHKGERQHNENNDVWPATVSGK